MSGWARWWQSRCPATTRSGDRCALRPWHSGDCGLRGDFGCMTFTVAWTGRLAHPTQPQEQR
jgi:hypothetical protein